VLQDKGVTRVLQDKGVASVLQECNKSVTRVLESVTLALCVPALILKATSTPMYECVNENCVETGQKQGCDKTIKSHDSNAIGMLLEPDVPAPANAHCALLSHTVVL
jgi:hypothetical protein